MMRPVIEIGTAIIQATVIAVMLAAMLGCHRGTSPTASTIDAGGSSLPVVPYCSLPWSRCAGPGVGSYDDGATTEQWWCCEPGGDCWPVTFASDCDVGPGGWLAYCEFGRSTEQSTADGEGWECLK